MDQPVWTSLGHSPTSRSLLFFTGWEWARRRLLSFVAEIEPRSKVSTGRGVEMDLGMGSGTGKLL